jgi:hypothetical protein
MFLFLFFIFYRLRRALRIIQFLAAFPEEADRFANEEYALGQRRAHERRQHFIAQLILVLLPRHGFFSVHVCVYLGACMHVCV